MTAWTLFELLLTFFANTNFCTKTRLCNIFKTTNTKTLIKSISETKTNFYKHHEKQLP